MQPVQEKLSYSVELWNRPMIIDWRSSDYCRYIEQSGIANHERLVDTVTDAGYYVSKTYDIAKQTVRAWVNFDNEQESVIFTLTYL